MQSGYERQVRHKRGKRREREEKRKGIRDRDRHTQMTVKSNQSTISVLRGTFLITDQLVKLLGRHIQQHLAISARNVSHVRVPCQRLHDRLARLNFPQSHKRIPRLFERLGNRQRCLCLSLSPDNRRLPFLVRLRGRQDTRPFHCQYISLPFPQ